MDLIDEAAKVAAGGFGVGGGFVAVRWFVNWVTGRLDKRQDRIDRADQEIATKWAEYREFLENHIKELREELGRYGKRIHDLEDGLEKCHEEKRALSERIAKLEGFATGRGEARQAEQITRSIDGAVNVAAFKKREAGE